MIIEVRGVNFVNKGAQLMLQAVCRHFEECGADVALVAEKRVGSYYERARLGLYQKFWVAKLGTINGLFPRISKRNFSRDYGVVSELDINAVLDASGFAFGDQWGPPKSDYLAWLSKRWKKQGKKLVMLPQAFGPFTDKATREAFSKVVDNADLIYARDAVSYEHLIGLGRRTDHIKIAPDFTGKLHGIVPDGFEPTLRQGCIIPNMRMIDKTSKEESSAYFDFLVKSARMLIERDIDPMVLIHETRDYELGLRMQSEIGDSIRIVQEQDPLLLKGIIGTCYVVIGSRYHGLIGALSQAVPCIATGWSHKYRMLFEDYGCPDLLVSTTSPDSDLASKLDALANEPSRSEAVQRLQVAGQSIKDRIDEMWSEVHRALGC